MINIIKSKKIIIVGVVGILLITTGILMSVFIKKPLPPFAGGSYYAGGGAEGYCAYKTNFEYLCTGDDGKEVQKYSYDPKTKKITYYDDENKPCREEYVIYVDEETKDFIYKYSYYGKDKEEIDIRSSDAKADYSNFGTEIKDISNIKLFEKYKAKTNGSKIQINKEKKEYKSAGYSGTFKIYKMKTDELPNYIVFSHKVNNYEAKEGYFIKEDGNLYKPSNLNVPAYIELN